MGAVGAETLPHEVRVLRDAWIPMPDGVRLSARVWLPVDAESRPVPGILELLPYRKSDGTAVRDSENAAWFAGHGYAVVRVDLRGTGNSEGIITDEYTPEELADGVACLDWIAAQPWCTGKVGMMGISWGGFNALQVAALAPQNLHAVLSLCSTDDRYADDVHFWGGALLADEHLPWATTMLAYNALPPEPHVWGTDWMQAWQHRLEQTPPFVQAWVEHQRRDDFWRHGSICEDPGRVECPVFLVSGWADAYRDAVFRMLESLRVPRRGLVGPWSHAWPQVAVPGPQIGFLQEALRWWDRWLKDVPNGAEGQPALCAWVQDSVPPSTYYDHRPGRWVVEEAWPSAGVPLRPVVLTSDGAQLGETSSPTSEVDVFPVQSHGVLGGRSCSYGKVFDLAADQRTEDAKSTCFTTEPLTESVDVLGIPEAEIRLMADRSQALVAVRVCDVAPDGSSTLITRGVLNLTHRNGHADPSPVAPGEWYTVRFPLHAIGYAVPAGHRLRVAISPDYWPMAWPSPEPTLLTVRVPDSRVHLPVRTRRDDDRDVVFSAPEHVRPFEHTALPVADRGEVTHDLPTDRVTVVYESGGGHAREELNEAMEYQSSSSDAFHIVENDPTSAVVESTRRVELRRGDWHIDVLATGQMSCDKDSFHVRTALTTRHNGRPVFERDWAFSTPRDFT